MNEEYHCFKPNENRLKLQYFKVIELPRFSYLLKDLHMATILVSKEQYFRQLLTSQAHRLMSEFQCQPVDKDHVNDNKHRHCLGTEKERWRKVFCYCNRYVGYLGVAFKKTNSRYVCIVTDATELRGSEVRRHRQPLSFALFAEREWDITRVCCMKKRDGLCCVHCCVRGVTDTVGLTRAVCIVDSTEGGNGCGSEKATGGLGRVDVSRIYRTDGAGRTVQDSQNEIDESMWMCIYTLYYPLICISKGDLQCFYFHRMIFFQIFFQDYQ